MFNPLRALGYGNQGQIVSTPTGTNLLTASDIVKGLTSVSAGTNLATLLLENNVGTAALRYAPLVAAERFITESIGTLPLLTYRRVGDGKERATDHPVYNVLRNRWNDFTIPFIAKKIILQNAIRYGHGLAIIERNNAGQVANIIPLKNQYVRIIFDGYTKTYQYESPNLTGQVAASDMIDVLGFTDDGICGRPLFMYAQTVVQIGNAIEEYTKNFFAGGTGSRGVISVPPGTSPQQYTAIVDAWRAANEGAGNHWKTPIMPYGATWTSAVPTNNDSQLLALREYQLLESARVMRVKPFVIQHYLNGGTYANLESQNLDLVQECLQHWITSFEEEINLKVFIPSDREDYFCEFLVDARLRGNIGDRYAAYKIGREGGWLSVNDIRRAENMSEVEGGDSYQTTPPGAAPNDTQSPKDNPPDPANEVGNG